MTIFFYKKLARNPEIENSPIWVLPNIRRLGRIRDPKLGYNQVTTFTVFELLTENQQGAKI